MLRPANWRAWPRSDIRSEAAGAPAGPEGATDGFGTNGAAGATEQPTDDATVEGEFREVGSDR